MLSNEEIDKLENLIVFSELNRLPLILSRAIPALFAELRVVRAALDEKTASFLGDLIDDRHGTSGANNSQPSPAADSGLHDRVVGVEPATQVPAAQKEGSVPDLDEGGGPKKARGKSARGRSRRDGDSPASGPYQELLDGRAGQQAVGREINQQDGGGGALPIAAHPKLGGA